jgi:signal transduction histidine kinase
MSKFKIEDKLVQTLLDIYSESTGIPVALYIHNEDKFIWSKKVSFSPLCQYLNDFSPEMNELCFSDHKKRCLLSAGIPELCYCGLWNIALPVKLDGEIISTLISGQRLLDNEQRKKESIDKFNSFLSVVKEKDKKTLRDLYKDTPEVSNEVFDGLLLQQLSHIQEYYYEIIHQKSEEDKIRRNKTQNLAHEFLLPIQAIVCNLQNIYNEINNKELKDIAYTSFCEAQQLALMVENMRGSFSDIEGPLEMKNENIYALILECISLFQSSAYEKKVIIKPPQEINFQTYPALMMSYEHVSRAFKNLIHNALKYSYSGTNEKYRYIKIKSYYKSDFFIIDISNYGIGVAEDEINHIFEEGFRGKMAKDEKRTGSGIGLSEVYKIFNKHGWRLKVDSVFQGQAYVTTVSIIIPISKK